MLAETLDTAQISSPNRINCFILDTLCEGLLFLPPWGVMDQEECFITLKSLAADRAHGQLLRTDAPTIHSPRACSLWASLQVTCPRAPARLCRVSRRQKKGLLGGVRSSRFAWFPAQNVWRFRKHRNPAATLRKSIVGAVGRVLGNRRGD